MEQKKIYLKPIALCTTVAAAQLLTISKDNVTNLNGGSSSLEQGTDQDEAAKDHKFSIWEEDLEEESWGSVSGR